MNNRVKHTAFVVNDEHLEHHGILGQKWGVRRYQNPDGSLTSAGLERYRTGELQIGYNKKGSYLTKEDGTKISRKERNQIIKEIKKDKEAKGEYKYLEKQVKNARQASNIGYVGNNPIMAMTINSIHKNSKNQLMVAEEKVNNYLKDYNNKTISELKKYV